MTRAPWMKIEAEAPASETGSLMPANPAAAPAKPSNSALRQAPLADDEGRDLGHALVRLEVREQERPGATHLARVAVHHVEIGTDQGRQVDLVDHQQVRAGDAGPALARDLLAGRDVDDIDREVR